MINTLQIGGYLYSKLSNIAKTYPIVAEDGTKYPFIVYQRVGLYSNDCKDGIYEDTATYQVVVVSDNYSKSIELAQQVRNSIEIYRDVYQKMDIHSVLVNAEEDYNNNAFVQKMQFQIKVN